MTPLRQTSTRTRPRGGGRRRRSSQPEAGTRERLFAAAAAEFAARGFAGANVDRIARAAHVNKAMIYYHFHSKAALYQEILGEMFHAVGERIRAVAASEAAPERKLEQFVAAIADAAEARPHFPPIWFREIAEEGAHLGAATMQEVAGIVHGLIAILQEGVRTPPRPQGEPAPGPRRHRRSAPAVPCECGRQAQAGERRGGRRGRVHARRSGGARAAGHARAR